MPNKVSDGIFCPQCLHGAHSWLGCQGDISGYKCSCKFPTIAADTLDAIVDSITEQNAQPQQVTIAPELPKPLTYNELADRVIELEREVTPVNPASAELPKPMQVRKTVADSLKAGFCAWVDARTAKGIATYGQPLMTFDGRPWGVDRLQEILDYCQYQEKDLLEALANWQAAEARAEKAEAQVARVREMVDPHVLELACDPANLQPGDTVHALIRRLVAVTLGGEPEARPNTDRIGSPSTEMLRRRLAARHRTLERVRDAVEQAVGSPAEPAPPGLA